MDREIKRKISELCDEAGSAAAAAVGEELIEDLEKEYEARVKAGMSELDAYRDIMKNVDEIKKMLDSMPLTEEETRWKRNRNNYRSNAKLMNKICSALWLLVVFVYLAFSLRFGGWQLTWLIFIWAAIGQIFMNMVKAYNKGVPLKKAMRGRMTAIVWLAIVMLYFIISIIGGGWSYTWLIFILAALIQKVIDIFIGE